MLYRNGFDLKTCLRMSPLKWDMSQPSEMFIAREIKHESRWYQISRLFIISNSWNLIPHIVLLISRLPEIIQKCFCTPDRALDPTFQMNQPYSMFLAGETVSSEWFSKVQVFFQHPLGTVHKCRLCVPLPTIRAKRVDCVSICRWGVRQTGRILTDPSPRRKSTFLAQTAFLLPNQTVELQSFWTASIIRDNFSFRSSSYTYAKAFRSGSSWSWSRASSTSRRSWRC